MKIIFHIEDEYHNVFLSSAKTIDVERITEPVFMDAVNEVHRGFLDDFPEWKSRVLIQLHIAKPHKNYDTKIGDAWFRGSKEICFKHCFIYPNWWKDARFVQFKSVFS